MDLVAQPAASSPKLKPPSHYGWVSARRLTGGKAKEETGPGALPETKPETELLAPSSQSRVLAAGQDSRKLAGTTAANFPNPAVASHRHANE